MRREPLTLNGLGRAVVVGLVVTAGSAVAGHVYGQQAPTSKVRLNQIIEQLEHGKPAFATEHWQFIDMEHGPYLIDQVSKLLADLRPAGASRPRLTPVVRMPLEGDEVVKSTIKQLLDQGVMAIIIPHVETKAQMENIVAAMRYPPQRGAKYPTPVGIRGWGPSRATLYWGMPASDYVRKADLWPLNPAGELLAIAMIETGLGVKNINEILQVPGLGAVLIGPSDLSMSLGVGTPAANPTAPEVEAATLQVARACVAHKVACGSFSSPDVRARVAQGFRLFTGAAGSYR